MSAIATVNTLNFKSLREQVYDYLREALNRGELAPGATIDVNAISRRLGISRTPLRDALLQLETEGFVTIAARRGCVVNVLSREEIRDLYEIIGALEASAIHNATHCLAPEGLAHMRRLNDEMRQALADDDFDRYYAANLHMHNCYVDLSPNVRLKRLVKTMKQRLYDFPRKGTFIKQWEVNSTAEHEQLIRLLESGDPRAAADYIRDVHWSYDVQEPFIEQYYFKELSTKGSSGER